MKLLKQMMSSGKRHVEEGCLAVDGLDSRGGTALLKQLPAGRSMHLSIYAVAAQMCAKDRRGDTALHVAAGHGRLDRLNLILDKLKTSAPTDHVDGCAHQRWRDAIYACSREGTC